jgi:hypothetical protein
MRPIAWKISLAFLALSSFGLAQNGNYFPLETGTAWLYRSTGPGASTTFRTISVEGRETVNGFEYARVRYFDRYLLLRAQPDGSIVSFNRAIGTDEPWLSFNGPAGTTFDSRIDECATQGAVDDRDREIATPAGRFTATVQLAFHGNCADAGATQQIYAAGVGPVVHEETSFAGPRRFELIHLHSAAGGTTGVSFTIGLDAPRYAPGASMAVQLTLRSTHPDAVKLHFTSGQSFDFKIVDESGAGVYTWSADKLFIAIIRDESFGPGERTYRFEVPLLNLRPGRYKAQGYLTTRPLMYLGETSFEIVP